MVNCMDTGTQIPPSLPLEKGGIPLFGLRPIGPLARREKGRFSEEYVYSIMDSLVIPPLANLPPCHILIGTFHLPVFAIENWVTIRYGFSNGLP